MQTGKRKKVRPSVLADLRISDIVEKGSQPPVNAVRVTRKKSKYSVNQDGNTNDSIEEKSAEEEEQEKEDKSPSSPTPEIVFYDQCHRSADVIDRVSDDRYNKQATGLPAMRKQFFSMANSNRAAVDEEYLLNLTHQD